jgi:type IV secretory pathway VirB10-like protein
MFNQAAAPRQPEALIGLSMTCTAIMPLPAARWHGVSDITADAAGAVTGSHPHGLSLPPRRRSPALADAEMALGTQAARAPPSGTAPRPPQDNAQQLELPAEAPLRGQYLRTQPFPADQAPATCQQRTRAYDRSRRRSVAPHRYACCAREVETASVGQQSDRPGAIKPQPERAGEWASERLSWGGAEPQHWRRARWDGHVKARGAPGSQRRPVRRGRSLAPSPSVTRVLQV